MTSFVTSRYNMLHSHLGTRWGCLLRRYSYPPGKLFREAELVDSSAKLRRLGEWYKDAANTILTFEKH